MATYIEEWHRDEVVQGPGGGNFVCAAVEWSFCLQVDTVQSNGFVSYVL